MKLSKLLGLTQVSASSLVSQEKPVNSLLYNKGCGARKLPQPWSDLQHLSDPPPSFDFQPSCDSSDQEQEEMDMSSCDVVENSVIYSNPYDAIIELDRAIKQDHLNHVQQLRYLSIRMYLEKVESGCSQYNASMDIAKALGGGSYRARNIRSWANIFQHLSLLPTSQRGLNQKTPSLLDDENVKQEVISYLRMNKFNINPDIFREHITTTILPRLNIIRSKVISKSTARRWLFRLGWDCHEYRKGIYVDGHERSDVVEDREKFIADYDELAKLTPTFSVDNLDIIEPTLPPNTSQHIFITHDESSFNANDGPKRGWGPVDEQPLLKKGRGRTLMISDFICETIGVLRLSPEQQLQFPNIPPIARTMHNTGANFDGYWTVEDLIKQVF